MAVSAGGGGLNLQNFQKGGGSFFEWGGDFFQEGGLQFLLKEIS